MGRRLIALGARLGGIYAGNVAGAIVGSLVAGFVMVPLLGAHTSLLLLAAVNVGVGVWLLLGRPHRMRERRGRRSAGIGALAWGATRPPVHTLVFHQRNPGQELLWYQEGLESTVSVARETASGTQILFTNSLGQSSDAPDIVRHHQRIGHLGALLAPRLERVLVIGLGVGSTAGAVAQHTGAGRGGRALAGGRARRALLRSHQRRCCCGRTSCWPSTTAATTCCERVSHTT